MYVWTEWVDESDQYENRYQETDNGDGTITHLKVRGEVYQEGTPMDAAHFNKIEQGIVDTQTAYLFMLNGLLQLDREIEERIDGSVLDVSTLAEFLLIAHDWQKAEIQALQKATVQETGTVTLTNTATFPFNNSAVSVPLTNTRDNMNYVVEVISVAATGGPAGEIEISDRQVNGFKMAFTGSASSVTVKYAVIGGYD